MDYRRILIAITVSVLANSALADTVRGFVLDESGKPVVGVVLAGTAWQRAPQTAPVRTQLKAISDSAGMFELTNVPSMPSAEHPIFLMAKMPNGHFSSVCLNTDMAKVTLLDHPVHLRIHAVDTKGAPIANASVQVSSVYSISKNQPIGGILYVASWQESEPSLAATTDIHGDADIGGLPGGEHANLLVQKPGSVRSNKIVALPIHGDAAENVELSMAVTLAGRVLAAGKPLIGVQVFAAAVRNQMYERFLGTTGPNGEYRIIDAPAGKINLNVELGKLKGEWLAKPFQDLKLAEGAELDGLDFVLEKGILLTGHVRTLAKDKPVPGAGVDISSEQGTSERVTTDANGLFSARVLAGSEYVSVTEIGGRRTNGQFYLSANVDAEHNPPLELRVPDTFLYAPIPHLAGTVVDKSRRPVADAIVRDLKSAIQTSTDALGQFRFAETTNPGDLVVATKDGSMSKTAVELAERSSISLSLDANAAVIQGTIVGEDGKPMPGVAVTLGGSEGKDFYSFPGQITDPDGRYRFEGLYGGMDSFLIWANKKGFGSNSIQPIKISPSETKTLDPMKMMLADGTIDGKVLEPDGKPAKGASVSSQCPESEDVITDDQGNFHLTSVPRGQHFVSVGRGGSFWTGEPAATGQKNVVIKLTPQPVAVAGVVSQDKSGQMAPPLRIASWLNGKPLDLKSLKGKIVVVDFWAVWCHPCVEAIPQVQALSVKYAKQGVVVIGVHMTGTPLEKVAAFVKQNHMTYPIGLDFPDKSGLGISAAAYVPQGIPTIYVIAQDGRIASESNEVADAVKAVGKLLGGGK